MITAIVFACLAVSLGWIALVNRLAYGFSRKLSRLVNRRIATSYGPRIFSIFSTWSDFRFSGDRNLLDELPDQYLVMSNHQSLFDIPLYMRFLDGPRLRFVAKAELAKHVPLVSLMLKSDQHCLVMRTGGPSQAMRAIDEFAERSRKNNWIPVIFPEGTRSPDGTLGTFHAAGFRRFLDKYPLPVAVCALDGGWRISKLSGLAKSVRGGKYRVKVLKIYPAPTNKAEQVKILEEGKALIEAQIAAWREEDGRSRPK